ncbi:MAG TPA: CBS domain-containing protein [Thermoanaerobaculia bacterium]|nr:CBS domain-containing protein [Thermoanaerobaculia bacterium]
MRSLVARDVMNSDVLTVRDEMSVIELAEFLTDNEISGAPVEDAEGRLIGVVSLTDIAAAVTGQRDMTVLDHPGPNFYLRTWEEKFNPEDLAGLRVADSGATVGEIMTPSIFAVDEETPISKVAERMIHSHVHRLLVTRDHKVVGILTTSDLLGLLVEAYEPGG